jgi:hypothetical protein
MMQRRTTLSADSKDLAVLEDEAHRRGVSLARVLRELVAEAAATRRGRRPRPRMGVFAGDGSGVGRLTADDEEAPADGRLRS